MIFATVKIDIEKWRYSDERFQSRSVKKPDRDLLQEFWMQHKKVEEKNDTHETSQKNFEEKLLVAHKTLMVRYFNIATIYRQQDIVDFCKKSLKLENPDKLSRWVGYVQGVLIERKILTVQQERDISRPIYQPIYKDMGYDISPV